MATFSVHFDGPITIDHKVSIRVLANTYAHMQRSIDRAFLIQRYGEVWKHARLKADQYAETEFLAEYPREGGIILDACRAHAGPFIDRVASAIRPVFEQALQNGLEQHANLDAQMAERREYVRGMQERTQTYEVVAEEPPANWASAYSNRSVVKEVDQLVSQVTPARLEGSTVEIGLTGDTQHLPFVFDGPIARRFHKIASQRELAAPMIVTATIRSLDRGNKFTRPSAKILNVATGREVTLQLSGEPDCDALHPHHNGQVVRIYACPIVEALGFDLKGGDLMFIAVAG